VQEDVPEPLLGHGVAGAPFARLKDGFGSGGVPASAAHVGYVVQSEHASRSGTFAEQSCRSAIVVGCRLPAMTGRSPTTASEQQESDVGKDGAIFRRSAIDDH
jgi:hypothetical protein